MTTEELLRDALHADADMGAAPANWDGVRTRGTRLGCKDAGVSREPRGAGGRRAVVREDPSAAG